MEGATWHVAPGGDDAGAGTVEAPLGSLGGALARSAVGDTILLERGGVYREHGLTVSGGRLVGGYGDPAGPLPVLCGSVEVGGWAPVAGSAVLVEAVLPAATYSISKGEALVFVDGERMTLARHPDSGWLRVDEGTDSTRIVDAELAALPGAGRNRWRDGQVRWRKWSWWFETRAISGDDGNGTLALGGTTSGNNTGIDSGYYIDNHRDALDAPGEWFWDKAAGKLLLYPPAGADWRTMAVEVAVRAQGLTVSGAVVRGLHVRHYTDVGIGVTGGGRVEDCVVEHVWRSGISATWGAAGSVVRGNTIRDVLNVGITWNENPAGAGGSVIERNHLQRCGTVPGLGGSGPWHAAGVIISNAPFGAKGVQFRLNRVEGTGYAGIILGRDGQTVERNVFRDTMNTLNDGAAVYTNCSYSFIRENIILDVEGDLESSHPWTPLGAGIWLEFLNNFHSSEVVANTVYGSGGDGLFLPNNFTCLIEGNVFLSNLRAGMTLGGHEAGRSDGQPNQNHVFRDNVIGIGAVPWAPTGFRNIASWGARDDTCLTYRVYTDRDLDFGAMSGTVFLTRDGKDLVTTTTGQNHTLAQWQAAEPAWADPAPRSVQGAAYLFINDTGAAVEFPLPADVGGAQWTDLAGAPVGPAVALQPFRSAVLLSGAGVVPGWPGYRLYSELPARAGYAEWAAGHGLAGEDAAPLADPDHDGSANLAEWLFDTLPASAASRPQPLIAAASGVLEVRYRLRRDHPGWTVAAEASPDLANWTDAALTDSGADAPPHMAVFAVQADADAAAFVRLRFEPTED